MKNFEDLIEVDCYIKKEPFFFGNFFDDMKFFFEYDHKSYRSESFFSPCKSCLFQSLNYYEVKLNSFYATMGRNMELNKNLYNSFRKLEKELGLSPCNIEISNFKGIPLLYFNDPDKYQTPLSRDFLAFLIKRTAYKDYYPKPEKDSKDKYDLLTKYAEETRKGLNAVKKYEGCNGILTATKYLNELYLNLNKLEREKLQPK